LWLLRYSANATGPRGIAMPGQSVLVDTAFSQTISHPPDGSLGTGERQAARSNSRIFVTFYGTKFLLYYIPLDISNYNVTMETKVAPALLRQEYSSRFRGRGSSLSFTL
jgi:hypothetical protein